MSWKPVLIAAGATSWIGSHLVLSHEPYRAQLVAKLGKQRFAGFYSLVSLATFLPTTIFYLRYAKGSGFRLFGPPGRVQSALGLTFKALGLVALSQVLTSHHDALIIFHPC